MERHVYQWTGGRTNTGLGIRIVYPNGATCLPLDWRKSKPWLSRNKDSVSEYQCLFFLQSTVRHVAPFGYTILIPRQPVFVLPLGTGGRANPGCLGIRIVYPNGATCLPVNWRKNKHWLSRNQDSVSELSLFRDNQGLLFLQSNGRNVAPLGYTILIPRKPVFVLRTNTGCLGIRIVYPNGATCLPVD
jgi:hypothetical protein